MSHIQNYYGKLDDLQRIAGAENEGALRHAFQSLLEAIGQEHSLILYAEYPFKTAQGAQLRADGVLMDRLRLVHGWWEAKDEKDNLDKEIEAKLAKGYPSDNIIFEDTRTAILLQNGQQVLRCTLADSVQLQRLLDEFFNYQLPAVANFRQARNKFLKELPQVSQALTELLTIAHKDNKPFQQRAEEFLQSCQNSIGERVTALHVDEMLIQHILTDQIFHAVFPDSRFHTDNHLAAAISNLESKFFRGETRHSLLKRLEPYFAAIRLAAAAAITSKEKQDFLKQVYEDFYTAYNPKDADKLGVVYTPSEVVRFIIEGCDWLTQKHFNKRLADSGLDILDPCMGTGTFIVDLLDYWRGDKHAVITKFASEVYANEISILPYYIACLNIEQTYYDITQQWCEFNGACFVNTLHNWGFNQSHVGENMDMFGSITVENRDRIKTQNKRKIPIIIGNPPYNANQKNENDNNKNEPAPAVDQRIKETYLKASTAKKTKLYDPYVRFFRWASDRLGDQGVLAFITNRSYLNGRSFDGFRKIVNTEFNEIWLVDLLGDIRDFSESLPNQGGNIFNIRTGVSICFFVRNPRLNGCTIHYLHAPSGASGVDKRRWLQANQLPALARAGEFRHIAPNIRGEWLNQPQEDWSAWLPMASKEVKVGKGERAIFKLYSLGISTNRDEWLYGMNAKDVASKVQYFLIHYDALRTNKATDDGGIKWSRNLKRRLASDRKEKYSNSIMQNVLYRPYTTRMLYRSKLLIDERGSADIIFPIDEKIQNVAICINGVSSNKSFGVIAVLKAPDLHFYGDTVSLPLWIYTTGGIQNDNITDWALNQFQSHYEIHVITKRTIFNYVYAVLHDPRYRAKYSLNLKAEFPRIPFHPDFVAWANIGEQLIQLHTYFEQVAPWDDLTRVNIPSTTTPKCRLKADKTKNIIEIDTITRLENIPPQAWQYQLGNRSALEWVLDQYKEKTPKDPTIREKFNTYRFADYKEQVIELLSKVCQVSVETMRLVDLITHYEF